LGQETCHSSAAKHWPARRTKIANIDSANSTVQSVTNSINKSICSAAQSFFKASIQDVANEPFL
jgi:hypothetical protein